MTSKTMNEMKISEICAETRQGERDLNEDSYVLIHKDLPDDILALLAVADGIGGLGSGHVASSTALTTVADIFRRLASRYGDTDDPPIMDWLCFAFQKANGAVMKMGLTMKELRGMGTTCTAVAVTKQGNLHICHVGDSRAYLLRNGHLAQLTEDDWYRGVRDSGADYGSSGAATKKAPRGRREQPLRRSGQPAEMTLVTQAIGWQPLISPARITDALLPADGILLCTDGLTDNLSMAEIERAAGSSADCSDICRKLVERSAATPGADNVTVALARFGE